MASPTVIVTGANRGIGRAAALGLAERGATVVLVCRDQKRAEQTAAEIRQRVETDAVHAVQADLASLAAVRQAAQEIRSRFDRVNVLINNAGIYTRERRETRDGLEMQFGVNHLGHFLLTRLLLPLLEASAPARIINVSSEAHHGSRLHFEDLQWRSRPYDPRDAYACSKLANILFTYELARRLNPDRVTANCLHPGVIATNMLREYFGLPKGMEFTLRATYASPEKGSDTAIFLALSEDVFRVTGKYFVKRREEPSSPESYDQQTQRRLWAESERLGGIEGIDR